MRERDFDAVVVYALWSTNYGGFTLRFFTFSSWLKILNYLF